MKKFLNCSIVVLLTLALVCGSVCVFAEERVSIDKLKEFDDTSADFTEVERIMHIDESNIVDEVVPATVRWDEASDPIIHEDNKDLFGIQFETNAGWELIVDSQGNLKPEYLKIAETLYDVPVVRWGGASANQYNLAKMILPMKQRELTPDYRTAKITSRDLTFGPVEFIKAIQAVNPDAKFSWTVSPWCATAQDTADFVHFLVDDASTKWGAMRESYGIHGPVPIYGLEIGNENYFTKEISDEDAKKGTDEYIARFREIAEKVEAIDPGIKLLPNVNGDSHRAGFYEWDRPIVKQLCDKYKTVAFHLYYSGYEFAFNGQWVDDFMKLCEEELGTNHGVKLAYTEHGKWDTQTCWSRMGNHSALATAHFLNIVGQRPETEMGTVTGGFSSAGVSTKWAWVTSFMDGTLQRTATDPVYDIYVKNIGDKIYKTDVLSDTTYTDPASTNRKFTAMATAKGNEVRLFMVNRLPYVNFDLTFDTKHDYTVKKEIVYTTPNNLSFSFSKNCEDVYHTTETEKNEPLSTYKMPGNALVCLILESKQGAGASDGKVTYKGDNRFTDIENNWAAPEINLLADAGVVTGVGDGLFDPNGGVTYAEFVTMLTRAFKMDAVGSSDQIFDNVPPDAWYFKPINTMALSGFIRRTAKIEPEQPVSMRDAIKMIYQKAGNPPPGDKTKYKSFYGWFKDLTDYEQNAFAYEMENEIISKLYDGKSVLPDTGLSRAETAALIYHAMQKLNK